MNTFLAVTVWFILSILTGVVANKKGKSFIGFFLFSMLMSPVIGALYAVFSKSNKLEAV